MCIPHDFAQNPCKILDGKIFIIRPRHQLVFGIGGD